MEDHKESTTIGVSHDTRSEINQRKSEIDAKRNEEVIKKLLAENEGTCLVGDEDTVRKMERIKRRHDNFTEEELVDRAVELLEDDLEGQVEQEEE